MRLTKFEHAALLLEKEGKKIFVDPGNMTTPLTEVDNTVAVVITHQHPDHWTPEQLARVHELSPEARVFSTAAVAEACPGVDVTVVTAGDTHRVGPFTLRFFGDTHAVIHRSIPVIDNVGVLINGELFYGGDSLVPPAGLAVDVLAVPAGAPWLTIGAVMDYVVAVAPRRSFPTHEMGLSRWGKDLAADRIRWATEAGGGQYLPLEPFDSYEI
ncbi:MBL fold metallo-hydrolase [Klugiella xanthotipulae]|uniref:L-ascorbate metabolism protein UlaG (Beta-lactamase superfamily) n=1 Tax=Klugiella xanthotipulae TaxID=244735 RepID=A0A543I409_9MICO|nr:MBL fold metallo-hydrolase [Klugiella xanthotipulae]TQM65332.1 L-ascorbate metabolism protein UlaG (beta-lactamase superfamily) [Klugiella xanthotipulae]